MLRFMGKTPAEQDHYLVPGLMRGLEALQCFTPARRRLTLGDLAAALGITRSATFRAAYTLTQLGFLVQDPVTSSYALGPAVLRLGYGYAASRELVEMALPYLEALHAGCGWSVHLGVLEGRDVVYLVRLAAQRGMSSIVHAGTRLPAHATSMGRVLLAGLPETEVAALYRGERVAGRAALPGLLRRRREDAGQATVVQDGGFEPGVASAAAAVRDGSGAVVAAINAATASAVAGGAEAIARVAALVAETAGQMSRRLAERA